MPLLGWGEYGVIDGHCWCSLNPNKDTLNWMVVLAMFYLIPTVLTSAMFVATGLSFKAQRNRILAMKNQDIASRPSKNISSSITFSSLQRSDGVEVYPEGARGTFTPKTPDQILPCTESHHSVHTTNTATLSDYCCEDLQQSQLETAEKSSEAEVEHENEQQTCEKIRVQVDINTCGINLAHKDKQVHIKKHSVYFHKGNCSSQTETHLETIEEIASCSNETSYEEKKDENQNTTKRRQGLHMKERKNTPEQIPTFLRENKNAFKEEKQPTSRGPKRDVKMGILVLLFSSYALLCGPSFFVRTIYSFNPNAVPRNAFLVALFMNTLNSFTNPFLYGFMSYDIRTEIRKLLCSIYNRASSS